MIKKTLSLLAFLFFVFSQLSAQITITQSAGWLESAYVKWQPLAGATSYEVYYKDATASDATYTEIDRMQIRQYAAYFRADVVGIKAGNYVLKVVPVFSNVEDPTQEAITESLSVKVYNRDGFAFSPKSPLKTGSGAYTDQGVLSPGAKVVYLTSKTANTMLLNVITDAKGKVATYTGIVAILAAKQKGYDTTPLAIRIVGEVKAADIAGLNSSSYIQIKGNKAYSALNMTIEGIGDDATTNGWSFLIRQAGNIEVRNLGIMNFGDDGVSLDTENTNVWVHNNDIYYGIQGSGDKAKGDGSFDLKGNSQYITSSYNHFWDAGKASLCGMTGESAPNYITYHHNWFDHSDSRHPRVRTMSVHVYNNYFDGNSKYGVGATEGSSVFVENNYFRNCKYPMLISRQGTDIFTDAKGTFSGEGGGMIKSYGNILITPKRFVDQTTNPTTFDAIEVSVRDEKVPATYVTLSDTTVYDNFDTDPNIMSPYVVEAPEDAKNSTMQYAGRVEGGDFKWTFDNAVDDASYDINPGLRTAVNNYTGKVLVIGFDNTGIVDPTEPIIPIDPTDPVDPTNPVDPTTPGDVIHNFTISGKTSDFFTITGSMNSTPGSVAYAGLTLTENLKMESATDISFTTIEASTLTLVFTSGFAKKVVIDGTSYTVTGGVFSIALSAGTHKITKGDTTNLFYMAVAYTSTTGIANFEQTQLALYPNPVIDNLYITSTLEIKTVDLYNILGVRVLQVTGDARSINMTHLSGGNYIVCIQTVDGSYKKMVIKK